MLILDPEPRYRHVRDRQLIVITDDKNEHNNDLLIIIYLI